MAKFVLVGESGGEPVEAELGALMVTLGRAESGKGSATSDFIGLADPAVSTAHAQLQLRGGRWYVIDLASTSGTRLDGELIMPNRLSLFAPGTVLQLGRSTALEMRSVHTEDERVPLPVDTAAPIFSLSGVGQHLTPSDRDRLVEMGAHLDAGVSEEGDPLAPEEQALLTPALPAVPQDPSIAQDPLGELAEALGADDPAPGPASEPALAPAPEPTASQQPQQPPYASPAPAPIAAPQPGVGWVTIATGVLCVAVLALLVLIIVQRIT